MKINGKIIVVCKKRANFAKQIIYLQIHRYSYISQLMGNLLESLKSYFNKTPQEVLNQDFEELSFLNELGPDAIAYLEYVKSRFGMEMSCSYAYNFQETNKFESNEMQYSNIYTANSLYPLAA